MKVEVLLVCGGGGGGGGGGEGKEKINLLRTVI